MSPDPPWRVLIESCDRDVLLLVQCLTVLIRCLYVADKIHWSSMSTITNTYSGQREQE